MEHLRMSTQPKEVSFINLPSRVDQLKIFADLIALARKDPKAARVLLGRAVVELHAIGHLNFVDSRIYTMGFMAGALDAGVFGYTMAIDMLDKAQRTGGAWNNGRWCFGNPKGSPVVE
jgi:hypothetical protein